MRRAILGAICFTLGAVSLLFAQTTGLRPDQFIALPWIWSAHQAVAPVALTDGSSIAVNGTDANAYTLTIAGNSHTLACPSTVSYGVYAFRFLNSGGSTGFAVNACYHFTAGTQPGWSTAAGKIDAMFCQAFNNSTLECSASIDSR